MNIRGLSPVQLARLTGRRKSADSAQPGQLSRRDFARTAAGTTLAGAVATQLWMPKQAEAGSFAPVPIPGGSPALGGAYHLFGPAAIDPIDAEPVSVTNLNGFVGLAYVSGMVTQTNTTTREVHRYPFVDSDMRFMQGEFRGTDGRLHQGAFAFV